MKLLLVLSVFIISCAHQGENKITRVGGGEAQVQPGSDDERHVNREKVRDSIRSSYKELKNCYEADFKKNPNISGKLVIHFEVRGEKAVNSNVLSKSESMSDDFTSCILSIIEKLTFPKPVNHEFYEVTYPFIFGKSSNIQSDPIGGR